jgi:DNA-binding Lrp family transcriptional regulator
MMDSTDQKLLSLLRDDARMPLASIAKRLGVSRGTVQNRLARLERDGVVLGYTVRLKASAEDQRIRALMTITVEGNRTDEVLKALRGDPAVCALHTTNGRWDIVAELRTDSLEAVDRVLGRIRLIEGISNSETSLLLSTHKY